jgi:hypothetical protein
MDPRPAGAQDGRVKARDVLLIGSGAAIAVAITWALVHPRPGEAFPAVFRGTTQGVTSDGDGVAFHPIPEYTDSFGAFPGFEVAGDNRTSAVRGEVCLAPGTAEQDVVFAAADYQLVWYACLTEGVLLP